MIDRLICIDTANTYPYKNLAMEEYMTTHVPRGTCILFLWQNYHSVIIGRNQNCWGECKVNFLEEEGGYLVRRLSGGGAVFHDLGNLNFTFMVRKNDYDVSKQLDVILEAVRSLGLKAEKTGRNDITVDGRKFSGNAFYRTGDCCYHHGTLLLDADKEYMSRYLNVSKEKLASKGVTSVKARVANLCEFCPDLTVDQMKNAMADAFSKVYGLEAERMDDSGFPPDEIQALTEKFESWQWKYGRRIPFEYEMERRFPWGGIQMQFHVDEGTIRDVNIFSDAMEQEMIGALAEGLGGCPYEEESICKVVEAAARSMRAGEAAAGSARAEETGAGSVRDGEAAPRSTQAGKAAASSARAEETGAGSVRDGEAAAGENVIPGCMEQDIMALIKECL